MRTASAAFLLKRLPIVMFRDNVERRFRGMQYRKLGIFRAEQRASALLVLAGVSDLRVGTDRFIGVSHVS